MSKQFQVTLTAIPNIPLIKKGDDVGKIIVQAMKDAGLTLKNKDVLVVSSKILSKAEGRVVNLDTVKPSRAARVLAKKTGRDPRSLELMLQEGKVIMTWKWVVETLHHLGFVCTSSGIDKSNIGSSEEDLVSLLPFDPDKSARKMKTTIQRLTGKTVGVVINDSLGVKYRNGSIGMAVGLAGLPALLKAKENEKDLYGKKRGYAISFADELSAAASLLMGQSDAGYPTVLINGLSYPNYSGKLSDLTATEQLHEVLLKNK